MIIAQEGSVWLEKSRPGHTVEIVKHDAHSDEYTIKHLTAHNVRKQSSLTSIKAKNFYQRYEPVKPEAKPEPALALIDHETSAVKLLEAAVSDPVASHPQGMTAANALVARAHVEAVLALVKQQRIANLIALHRHEVEHLINTESVLYEQHAEGTEGVPTLRAHIKAALFPET